VLHLLIFIHALSMYPALMMINPLLANSGGESTPQGRSIFRKLLLCRLCCRVWYRCM